MFGYMKAHRLLALVLGLSTLGLVGVAQGMPLVVRTAQGKAVVYVFPFVGLWRYDEPRDTTPKQRYFLMISHWLNEPEVSGQTGDTNLKPLVNVVTKLAIDERKHLLYGHGSDPDSSAWPDAERYFVIATDRVYFFRDLQQWTAFLGKRYQIRDLRAESVDVVFSRLLKRAEPGGAVHDLPASPPDRH
jgi:hypothetical protein